MTFSAPSEFTAGDGPGGFTGRTDYAVGFFPYTIGAGDFDRDAA